MSEQTPEPVAEPKEEHRLDATRDDDPENWMPGDRGWTC